MRAQTTYIMANKKEKLTIERSVPRHYYLAWIASQARNDYYEKPTNMPSINDDL